MSDKCPAITATSILRRSGRNEAGAGVRIGPPARRWGRSVTLHALIFRAVRRHGSDHVDHRPRWVLGDPSPGPVLSGDLPRPLTDRRGPRAESPAFGPRPRRTHRVRPRIRSSPVVPFRRTVPRPGVAVPAPEFPRDCRDLSAAGSAGPADPHRIQVREDLDAMVAGGYCEPATSSSSTRPVRRAGRIRASQR
jgi:hypothetical protein